MCFFVEVWVPVPENKTSFPLAGTLLVGSPEFICYHFVTLGEGFPIYMGLPSGYKMCT